MKSYRQQRIRHKGVIHKIFGKAYPGSAADYLMLKRYFTRIEDDWVLKTFKNGKQLLFNTAFVKSMKDGHKGLHCEFCGKQPLKQIYWHQMMPKNRTNIATADHFYPKSLNKEILSTDLRNMVIACEPCNTDKDDSIYSINTLKFPYLETIKNITELANELKIKI